MNDDQISTAVILQRVRNRVIEYLEMLCAYEFDPPPWDLNETLEQWLDWTGGDEPFPIPPYNSQEKQLLDDVHATWDRFCDCTPKRIVDAQSEMERVQWFEFQSAAKAALNALCARGRLSEHVEEPPLERGRKRLK